MEKETVDVLVEEQLKGEAYTKFREEYNKAVEAITNNAFLGELEVETTVSGISHFGSNKLKYLIEHSNLRISDQFEQQQEEYIEQYVRTHKRQLVQKLIGKIE